MTQIGLVQWLMPGILALWEAKTGTSPAVRSSSLPQMVKPIPTKNTKLAVRGGACL